MSLNIGSLGPGAVLELTWSLVQKVDIKGEDSGYLVIMDRSDGRLLLHAQIGDCPPDKHEMYREFSLEKAMRIYRNGDISSWATRDPDNDKYGGGIKGNNLILAFSGLSEEADEAVVLVLALGMNWIGDEDASRIMLISDNKLVKKLF